MEKGLKMDAKENIKDVQTLEVLIPEAVIVGAMRAGLSDREVHGLITLELLMAANELGRKGRKVVSVEQAKKISIRKALDFIYYISHEPFPPANVSHLPLERPKGEGMGDGQ